MKKISEMFAAGRTLSFEFFPPKTEQAQAQLVHTLRDLEELDPSFVSVTYGAGGSTRQLTHDLVVGIAKTTMLVPMAHLACYGHTKDEINKVLARYSDSGIANILALAGDPPRNNPDMPPGDFRYASDLVAAIREFENDVLGESKFAVGVAAHPDGHPRSQTKQDDWDYTAKKLEDADFAITQFFFESKSYWQLCEEVASRGIAKPIVPGIMPVTDLKQISNMAKMSGTPLPQKLVEKLESANSAEETIEVGINYAVEMCEELLTGGVPGLHFYTLNRSTATRTIAQRLGLTSSHNQ